MLAAITGMKWERLIERTLVGLARAKETKDARLEA